MYLHAVILSAMEDLPIHFFKAMYRLNALSEDIYETMTKLEEMGLYDDLIILQLFMEDIKEPNRYIRFKEGLKKINSLQRLHHQIDFIG